MAEIQLNPEQKANIFDPLEEVILEYQDRFLTVTRVLKLLLNRVVFVNNGPDNYNVNEDGQKIKEANEYLLKIIKQIRQAGVLAEEQKLNVTGASLVRTTDVPRQLHNLCPYIYADRRKERDQREKSSGNGYPINEISHDREEVELYLNALHGFFFRNISTGLLIKSSLSQ